MLRVDKEVFEKMVIRIVGVTDLRELTGEFSGDKVFFCSLLKDISRGKDSPNYHVLREIAKDIMISEQFIIDQAKSILSFFAPDEPKEDYYRILNVSHLASTDEIRKSWLDLVKTHHPDRVGDQGLDITKKLNEAYEVLGNPVKRGEYEARCLPMLPVAVIGHSMGVDSKRFVYVASLSIVILAVVFYIAKSGLLFRLANEKGETTKEQTELPMRGAISGSDMKKPTLPQSQKKRVAMALPLSKGAEETFISKGASSGNSGEKGKIVVESKQELRPPILKEMPLAEAKVEEKKKIVVPLPKESEFKKTVIVKQEANIEGTSKRKRGISRREPKYRWIAKEGLEEEKPNVSSASAKEIKPSYDKASLYFFVSEYASAYKSRDMNLFLSFFEPDARENGVEISRAISLYKKNFSSFEIMAYDIRIENIDFNGDEASVNGSFTIFFRNKSDQRIKSSNGVINWTLLWQDKRWRIKELNYVIKE